jgi:hypothetical protein
MCFQYLKCHFKAIIGTNYDSFFSNVSYLAWSDLAYEFNEQNQMVGIEILRVRERVPLSHLKQMSFEVA